MILSSIGRNDNGISSSCVVRFWPGVVSRNRPKWPEALGRQAAGMAACVRFDAYTDLAA